MDVQRFRIYCHEAGDATTTDPRTHDLTILPVDRMAAERASTADLPPSQRGPGAAKHHPNTWLLLWLWASAKRAKLTDQKFAEWSGTVLDFDRLDANGQLVTDDTDPEDVEEPQLDPTSGAAATS